MDTVTQPPGPGRPRGPGQPRGRTRPHGRGDAAHDGFRSGLRTGAGLAAAAFLLAVSFGALTQAQGWGPIAPVVCSLVVFSGSAQFAMVATLGAGGGALAAVVAAALVNVRYVPMGIAVARDLRGGRLRRALEGQAVVDGSWAAAHLGGGRFDRRLLFGASLVQWPSWVVGTAVGTAAAPDPDLLHTLGLDALTPALFAVLLLDELTRGRQAWLSAGVGAGVAGALIAVVPAGPALVAGAGAAALVALVRDRRGEGRADKDRNGDRRDHGDHGDHGDHKEATLR
ncbi:branched-chain amino acid ABC transporter permease [Streptomyces triticagri]|uniref:Branched-chain amino acid ABC transporter permease n=1 Tax=Streptomyces triticagri TaxID=2293568 RepID=A0A372M4S0_9ACTN|nr:AzlC family ABC transporter permease [Streptomyces triticagri]RFU85938.1 branched-chain amino acid ABC transporter permease [Streptomyces triticagri]